MRLPNNYGSVYKMGGKRRRPWRIVKDGKTVGYAITRAEGLKILAEYQDKEPNEATFEDVYNAWCETRETVQDYYRHSFEKCEPLHKMRMADITADDLMDIIRAQTGKSAPEKISILYSQLYKYALRHDIVTKNCAKLMDSIPKATPKKKIPFTPEEIKQLWDDDTEIARMALVGIYSGWRPTEMLEMTIEGDLMKGGIKTEAGKDRVVPIHPYIQDIVQEYSIDYTEYYKRFKKLMKILGMEHSPHDCRVTFSTLCAEYGVNEHVRKLLMGHVDSDITERVYTWRKIEQLREEIKKIE